MLATFALLALPAVASEVAKLHAIFDKNWETRLRESPLFATSVGRHEYDDRMPSVTMANLERRQGERKATLAALAKIDRAKLPASEKGNYAIIKRHITKTSGSFDFGDYQSPITAVS